MAALLSPIRSIGARARLALDQRPAMDFILKHITALFAFEFSLLFLHVIETNTFVLLANRHSSFQRPSEITIDTHGIFVPWL